jgi:prepilin-type N-terminal cleavage/methylation domain-containing protein
MTTRTSSGPSTRWGHVRKCLVDRNRPAGGRDDSGMTLMEVLIASTLLVVLLTAVMVTMNLLGTISENVSTQYQEYDQIIPALGPFKSLLRSEVEPAPANAGLPTPGFYSVGNFNVTFYARIGTSNNNVNSQGVSAGPALIVAAEYNAAGTVATSCSVTAPCSFQVREYLPIVAAGTAPGSTPPCTFALPSPYTLPNCAYPATYKLEANVNNVINDPSSAFSQTNPPLFTYGVSDTAGNTPYLLTTTQLKNQTNLTCQTNSGTGCPLDYIQSVGVDLVVGKKGSGPNGYVENQSIVYRYAQSPGSSSYPFQYTGTWG